MTTYPSYFEDTYKFNDSARITRTAKDEQGHFIVLNQTIFYPQGGGQPSDQGTIQVENTVIPIHSVKSVEHEIRHYTDQDYTHLIGEEGACLLDQELRLLHARLHTAGHFISNVIERSYPQWVAVKGHHFPEQCYVEFADQSWAVENISLMWVNQEIEKMITQDFAIHKDQMTGDKLQELCPNLPFRVPQEQTLRVIRIGDLPFSPCGGTHVKSLNELKGLKITKHKIKKNTLKIYYDIHAEPF